MFKVNDFFCGCGGMGLGFKQAGYETVGAWDYDKFAVESYAHNVDPIVKQISIMDQKGSDVSKADVWTFGFPCQDISISGKQKGITVKCDECGMEYTLSDDMPSCLICGSDKYRAGSRSGLFFEVMRLLSETPLRDKPSVIMAENVKNLKKSLPVLEKYYAEQGYVMYYELYNSKYWGVPQNRERYFVVGIREDIFLKFEFPTEVKEVKTRLLDVLDAEVDEKYYYSDEKAEKIIEQAIYKMGRDWVDTFLVDLSQWRREGALRIYKDKATTLAARDYKEPRVIVEPRVVAQRGRYSEDGTIYQNTEVQKGGISNNLTSVQKDNLLLEPNIKVIGALDINGHDIIKRVYDPTGLAPTATAVKGGNQQIKVIMPVPEATKKGYSVAEVGDSINLSHINSETRRGRVGVGVAQTLTTGAHQYTIDPSTFRVRKLTPNEYGRLQGFPIDDGWEQIVSNSQAYKQFGNAVTVNVAKVLAEAIRNQILLPMSLLD